MITFDIYLAQKNYSPATITTYTKYLQNFTQWLAVESLTAAEVTYTGLLEYIRWLQEKGKKNAFIQHILCPLRHYFNYLVVTGERRDNPAAGLFIKGITRRLPGNLLSLEQLQQLYEQYNIQLHVPVVKKIMLGLLIYQGITVEELRRLEAADFYLQEGKVNIGGSRHSNQRWLKLEPVQVLHLQEYLKVNRFKAGPVFTVEKNGIIGKHNIVCQVNWMMRQLRQLNPKLINPQQIRSSVITAWLKPYHLRQVQYMAGHRYVSSTQRYQVSHLEDLQSSLRRHHPMK